MTNMMGAHLYLLGQPVTIQNTCLNDGTSVRGQSPPASTTSNALNTVRQCICSFQSGNQVLHILSSTPRSGASDGN